MIDERSRADPVGQLAEDFMARYRRGERPALSEYTDKYPELADRIRDVFPMLVLMEQADSSSASSPDATGPGPARDRHLHERRPERIAGYRILREVGRGGMGVVYEAEQLALGRHVALKVLPDPLAQDPKGLERFRREARAAARLHHTNIVPVYEVGQDGGTVFYTMQFIQGQPLDVVLDELKALRQKPDAPRGPDAHDPPAAETLGSAAKVARSLLTGITLTGAAPQAQGHQAADARTEPWSGRSDSSPDPATGLSSDAARSTASVVLPGQSEHSAATGRRHYYRSVAQVGIQVAEALAYAHREGVIHRDIKPSNLLLDADSRVWITDFGLAKSDGDALTHTGDILGTIRYMAPERFRGWSDPRSDVYSLGLTLYEMLLLRPAFATADRLELIRRITHEEPIRPRTLDPHIPRDLETIVLKAIDKEPSRRYASAGELAADLRRFLQDRPIRARRVSSAERLLRWGRRNKLVAGLLASLVVTLVAGFIVSTTQWIRAEANAEQLAQQLYTSDMRVIQQLDEAGDIGRMGELLHRHIPRPGQTDRRGFEWYVFWWRYQEAQLIRTLPLNDVVWDMEATPDGRIVAALILEHEFDKVQVTLWDAATDWEPRTFYGPHHGRPGTFTASVALSPDGRYFATGSDFDELGRKRNGQIVNIHDSATGELLRSLVGPDEPTDTLEQNALAFSSDGKMLISGSSDTTIKLWDIESGEVLQTYPASGGEGHSGGIRGLAFALDGRWIASAGRDKQVRLWNVESHEGFLIGEFSTVATDVAFSPAGRYLAAGSWASEARVWDVSDPQNPREIALRGQPLSTTLSVSFSSDGRYLATSNSNTVTLWQVGDGESWEAQATLKGHANLVWSVLFLDGGRMLASGGWDRTVKLWDITRAGAERDTLLGHPGIVFALAFTPEGQTLVSGDTNGMIKRWQVSTGRAGPPLEVPREGHASLGVEAPGMIFGLAIHGRTLADNYGRLWDLETGRLLEPLAEQAASGRPVVFSPDGAILATTADDECSIVLWDVSTRNRQSLPRHKWPVPSLAFSPEGAILASGSVDRTVRLWDVVTRRLLAQLDHTFGGHTGIVNSIAFSSEGRTLASGSADGTVKLWDVAEAAAPSLRHTLAGHVGTVYAVAYSPDGKTIASASEDKTIKLWDPTTGRERCTLVGHTSKVTALAFSPDGRVLASGDATGTIRLWRAR